MMYIYLNQCLIIVIYKWYLCSRLLALGNTGHFVSRHSLHVLRKKRTLPRNEMGGNPDTHARARGEPVKGSASLQIRVAYCTATGCSSTRAF